MLGNSRSKMLKAGSKFTNSLWPSTEKWRDCNRETEDSPLAKLKVVELLLIIINTEFEELGCNHSSQTAGHWMMPIKSFQKKKKI